MGRTSQQLSLAKLLSATELLCVSSLTVARLSHSVGKMSSSKVRKDCYLAYKVSVGGSWQPGSQTQRENIIVTK